MEDYGLFKLDYELLLVYLLVSVDFFVKVGFGDIVCKLDIVVFDGNWVCFVDDIVVDVDVVIFVMGYNMRFLFFDDFEL